MQPFDKIHEYSKIVCNQIRWQSAHDSVVKEIENHILDQRDAYIADGLGEMEATENAIRQMGDPIMIGTQLDRTHRPKPQWRMLLLTLLIVIMGVLIRQFLIPSPSSTIFEMISIIMGLSFMLIAYFSDFTLIGKYPKSILTGIVGVSIVVMNTSPMFNGRLYYAAFMPLLFPIGFVAVIYATRNKGYLGILLCGLSFIILSSLTMRIPSAAGLFNLGAVAVSLLGVVAYKNWFNLKNRKVYLIGFITMTLVLMYWILRRYSIFSERFNIIFNPSKVNGGGSYISTGIRHMMSNSKFIGHGNLFTGPATSNFQIPDVSTDFLLTYLIYNYGWITFVGLMSILFFFIFKGFKQSISQRSNLGLLVSLSIMITFTIQILGSVLWSFGFQLIAPMTFPLISHGHIATLINLTLIGIMLSVFRTGDIVKDQKYDSSQRERFISFHEGKLIIDFGNKHRC